MSLAGTSNSLAGTSTRPAHVSHSTPVTSRSARFDTSPARPVSVSVERRGRYSCQATTRDTGVAYSVKDKRTVTLIGDRRPSPLNAAPYEVNDPVLLEMRKVPLRPESVVDQIAGLDNEVRSLCDAVCEAVGAGKRLPRHRRSMPLPSHFPTETPPNFLMSVDDYVFYTLISKINRHLCDDIFLPFHPTISSSENRRFKAAYEEMTGISPPIASSRWRADTFASIDRTVTDAIHNETIERIVRSITDEFISPLQTLPGPLNLPQTYNADLASIVGLALNINRGMKLDVSGCEFKPFFIEEGLTWDPVRMEEAPKSKFTLPKGHESHGAHSARDAHDTKPHEHSAELQMLQTGTQGPPTSTTPGSAIKSQDPGTTNFWTPNTGPTSVEPDGTRNAAQTGGWGPLQDPNLPVHSSLAESLLTTAHSANIGSVGMDAKREPETIVHATRSFQRHGDLSLPAESRRTVRFCFSLGLSVLEGPTRVSRVLRKAQVFLTESHVDEGSRIEADPPPVSLAPHHSSAPGFCGFKLSFKKERSERKESESRKAKMP